MSYQVGIDLGTTFSAAAVCHPGRPARPEIVPLTPNAAFMPSVVFLNPDATFLVGEDAQGQALTDPGRVARQFKRRIGDGTPLWIGGAALTAEQIAARFVAGLLNAVTLRIGGSPSRIALTHPAGWGSHRLESLRAALAAQNIGPVLFLPEPTAAVLAYASGESGGQRLEPGAAVAVYDLGTGSFDSAVVRVLAPDRHVLLGQPEEIDLGLHGGLHGGLLDFDEVVFDHVRSAVGPAWDALDPTNPAVLASVAQLRRNCVAAKEALSANTDVLIPVVLPGIDTQVRLTRAEFEEMIRPAVDETVSALQRSAGSAGVAPDELSAVLLVGGSSRIPLITQEISARLGRPVSVPADPKGIIARGAALAASNQEADLVPRGMPTDQVAPVPVAPELSRPPLDSPAVPPVIRIDGSKRRLVATIATAVLAASLAVGSIALADRLSSPGADATTPTETTTATTTQTTTEPVPTEKLSTTTRQSTSTQRSTTSRTGTTTPSRTSNTTSQSTQTTTATTSTSTAPPPTTTTSAAAATSTTTTAGPTTSAAGTSGEATTSTSGITGGATGTPSATT